MAETTAHKAFRLTIKRPQALLEMFDGGSLKPWRGTSAAPASRRARRTSSCARRSSLPSGLDAYLSDVPAEVLVAQLENADTPASDARNVLEQVTDEIKTLPLSSPL